MTDLCGGVPSPEKVFAALKQLYGGDHKPENQDVRRAAGRAAARTAETCFGEEEYDEEYEEDIYYEDEGDEAVEDDEIPQELDEAYYECEEAMATWQEARRKMNELARARGFYPVVALTPQGQIPVGAQQQRGGGKGRGG